MLGMTRRLGSGQGGLEQSHRICFTPQGSMHDPGRDRHRAADVAILAGSGQRLRFEHGALGSRRVLEPQSRQGNDGECMRRFGVLPALLEVASGACRPLRPSVGFPAASKTSANATSAVAMVTVSPIRCRT